MSNDIIIGIINCLTNVEFSVGLYKYMYTVIPKSLLHEQQIRNKYSI